MKEKQYFTIVYKETEEDLKVEVEARKEKGWQSIGDLVILKGTEKRRYMQAMMGYGEKCKEYDGLYWSESHPKSFLPYLDLLLPSTGE